MKRWLLRIFVCLILGAISTVGVAWGIAASVNVLQGEFIRASTLVNGDSELAVFVGWERTGAAHWSSHQRNYDLEDGPSRTQFKREHTTTDESPFMLMPSWGNLSLEGVVLGPASGMSDPNAGEISHKADGRGWPMLALWSEYERKHGTTTSWQYDLKRGGIPLPSEPWREGPSGYPYDKALPLLPIWPGFLINTLFYSAIWFAMLFGFRGAKRFIRIKRGRCPRCGYDLRGQRMDHGQDARATAGCPECGWNRAAK